MQLEGRTDHPNYAMSAFTFSSMWRLHLRELRCGGRAGRAFRQALLRASAVVPGRRAPFGWRGRAEHRAQTALLLCVHPAAGLQQPAPCCMLAGGKLCTTAATSPHPWLRWGWPWTPEAQHTSQASEQCVVRHNQLDSPHRSCTAWVMCTAVHLSTNKWTASTVLHTVVMHGHGCTPVPHRRRLHHRSRHGCEGLQRQARPHAQRILERGLCLLPTQALVAAPGGARRATRAGATPGRAGCVLAGRQGEGWGLKGWGHPRVISCQQRHASMHLAGAANKLCRLPHLVHLWFAMLPSPSQLYVAGGYCGLSFPAAAEQSVQELE